MTSGDSGVADLSRFDPLPTGVANEVGTGGGGPLLVFVASPAEPADPLVRSSTGPGLGEGAGGC